MIVQRRVYQLQKRSASYGCDYKLVSSSQLELASKAISQPELRSPTLVIIVFLARVDMLNSSFNRAKKIEKSAFLGSLTYALVREVCTS